MVVVAARPSVGKTAFALNIAAHAASKLQKGVLLFSLEMSKEQLVQRLICLVGSIDAQRLRTGYLAQKEFQKVQAAVAVLDKANIYIDETPSITALELRSKARRHAARNPVDLVIIDYMQLMSSPGRSENRQVEIADISRSIKGLARELRVPVMALSQLSREAEKDDSGMPKLMHLRESGAIEQDADVVLMLSRPRPEPGRENVIQVNIAKQRNGPTGHIELVFEKNIQRFGDFAAVNAPAPITGMGKDFDPGAYEEDDVPFI
jgi:replicative DNA helicase